MDTYNDISVKSYASNIEIYATHRSDPEYRGRVAIITCTGDEVIRGCSSGYDLASHFSSLSAKGQTRLINEYGGLPL